MAGRVRVFIACSLDGFIAGEDDDLSWLPDSPADHGYDAFIADVGALLIGRGTFDVVAGFDPWPYGERPVLVATTRALVAPGPTLRAVGGPIAAQHHQAPQVAGDRDVYLDGGDLIRQALDADLIDELTVTIIPVILGAGHPLFAGVAHRRHLALVGHQVVDGLVQATYHPIGITTAGPTASPPPPGPSQR